MKQNYTVKTVLSLLLITVFSFVPTIANASPAFKISGFFVSAQDKKGNIDMLKDIKKHGGNTVISFGYTLNKTNIKNVKTGVYKDCKVNGKSCVDSIREGKSVRNILSYTGNTEFSSKHKRCGRDIILKSNSRSYAFFAVPVNGTCKTATQFDIIATTFAGIDKAKSLSIEAANLGMKHYIGMPSPDKDAKQPWLPDTSYLGTLKNFTKRFINANETRGIGGYYQHREMPLSTHSSWNGMLRLYKTQNQAIAEASVIKRGMVSPYIDARKHMNQPPKVAEQAIKKIGNTKGNLNTLIIAPQDGVGTGKGTPYSTQEWLYKVDPFQRTVVGNKTNAQAYYGNSQAYFAHMKKGAKSMKGVQLWANIEGMAPVIKSGTNRNVCSTGHSDARGFTWQSRLKKQVNNVKPHVSKTISYHWNYYNCPIGKTTPKDYLKNL